MESLPSRAAGVAIRVSAVLCPSGLQVFWQQGSDNYTVLRSPRMLCLYQKAAGLYLSSERSSNLLFARRSLVVEDSYTRAHFYRSGGVFLWPSEEGVSLPQECKDFR